MAKVADVSRHAPNAFVGASPTLLSTCHGTHRVGKSDCIAYANGVVMSRCVARAVVTRTVLAVVTRRKSDCDRIALAKVAIVRKFKASVQVMVFAVNVVELL